MIAYIDSSALVKKYIAEIGSDNLRGLLRHTSSLITSLLTELEMTAFFERSKRESRLDSSLYRQITAAFEKDSRTGNIGFIAIREEIMQTAKRLIKQRRLRVQDAIQLSSALIALKSAGQILHFICADHFLLDAARIEGLKCYDVSK